MSRASQHDVDQSSSADTVARIGYAAHGIVYGLVAVLALDAAFGGGGEQAKGSREALATLATGDWGTALLTLLTAGLVAYGLTRLWQAISPATSTDGGGKAVAKRGGLVVSGLVQIVLAVFALSLAFGWFSGGGGGSGGGASDLTARVLSWPGGRWIVGVAGVAIVMAAFYQLKKAWKAGFMDKLAATARRKRWVKPTCRAGFAARFVVFLIIGGFVIVAAWQADPSEAEGLGGALRTLRDQPFGPWLLGLVAVGLLAFAVAREVQARYLIKPTQK